MKSHKKITSSILSCLFAFIVLVHSCGKKEDISVRRHVLPIKSFIKLDAVANLNIEGCDKPLENINCTPRSESESLGTASGVLITPKMILSAGHFCELILTGQIEANSFTHESLNSPNTPKGDAFVVAHAIDHQGKNHNVEIIAISNDNDICLLKSDTEQSSFAKLADKMPERGERIYNIAAPFGLFDKNMALIFDGFYAGESWEGDSYFTVPARPGSSGSPLFNEKGEIIALIFAAHPEFETMSYAINLNDIKNFLIETSDQSDAH